MNILRVNKTLHKYKIEYAKANNNIEQNFPSLIYYTGCSKNSFTLYRDSSMKTNTTA